MNFLIKNILLRWTKNDYLSHNTKKCFSIVFLAFFQHSGVGSPDVFNQATKHIQDYKNDVRRINECLDIAKQQQVDSLLEKRKLRQQLKDAEMEEKKQREALDCVQMNYETTKNEGVAERENHDDDNDGGEEAKEEAVLSGEDSGSDTHVSYQELENNEYDVSEGHISYVMKLNY